MRSRALGYRFIVGALAVLTGMDLAHGQGTAGEDLTKKARASQLISRLGQEISGSLPDIITDPRSAVTVFLVLRDGLIEYKRRKGKFPDELEDMKLLGIIDTIPLDITETELYYEAAISAGTYPLVILSSVTGVQLWPGDDEVLGNADDFIIDDDVLKNYPDLEAFNRQGDKPASAEEALPSEDAQPEAREASLAMRISYPQDPKFRTHIWPGWTAEGALDPTPIWISSGTSASVRLGEITVWIEMETKWSAEDDKAWIWVKATCFSKVTIDQGTLQWLYNQLLHVTAFVGITPSMLGLHSAAALGDVLVAVLGKRVNFDQEEIGECYRVGCLRNTENCVYNEEPMEIKAPHPEAEAQAFDFGALAPSHDGSWLTLEWNWDKEPVEGCLSATPVATAIKRVARCSGITININEAAFAEIQVGISPSGGVELIAEAGLGVEGLRQFSRYLEQAISIGPTVRDQLKVHIQYPAPVRVLVKGGAGDKDKFVVLPPPPTRKFVWMCDAYGMPTQPPDLPPPPHQPPTEVLTPPGRADEPSGPPPPPREPDHRDRPTLPPHEVW